MKMKNATYTYTNNSTAQPGDVLSKQQDACSFYQSPAWLWKLPILFEGIVHCIDKETSSILILAKKPGFRTCVARILSGTDHSQNVPGDYRWIAHLCGGCKLSNKHRGCGFPNVGDFNPASSQAGSSNLGAALSLPTTQTNHQ